MDQGRIGILRGDELFIRGEYTSALAQFRQAFSLSVDEESRTNSVKNGLAAEKALGISQHSLYFNFYASRPQRPLIQNGRQFPEMSKGGDDDAKEKPSEALFNATLDVDKDNWSANSFFERATMYYHLGDYASAMHDLETVDALDPHGDAHWEWIAECAIASGQYEALADAIRQGQKRGVDMFLYQCIHALKTNRLKELTALCQKIMAPCNPRLLEVRMQMNIQLGNYRTAWADAARLENAAFPWMMFFQDRLPSVWDFDKHHQSQYLAMVRDGFFRSFESGSIYETPFDLGIDQHYQNMWVNGEVDRSFEYSNVDCHYPADFEFNLDQKLFSPSLLKDAISYGKLVLSSSRDKRKLACVGFAMLELAQLFDEYLAGGKSVPSLSLILSIAMNWMRLADPSKPVFLSSVASCKDNVIYLEKDGNPTKLHEFIPVVFACFRDNFPVTGLVNWDGITGPDDLIRRSPIHFEVQIPGSPARVFSCLSRNNRSNFGIIWPSNDNNDSFHRILSRIFMDVKRGDPELCFEDALLFLFEWLRRKPITAFSKEIGMAIFVALLHSIVGLELDDSLPLGSDIQLLAVFSQSFKQFCQSIKEKFQVQVVKSLKIACLPKIVEVMPNWHLRIQALRFIEESDMRS